MWRLSHVAATRLELEGFRLANRTAGLPHWLDARLRLADIRSRLFPDEFVRRQPTLTVSSTRRLSDSSDPVSSNEFVNAALPFSTLVMT